MHPESVPYTVNRIDFKSRPELWESPEMTDLNMTKVWEATSSWFESMGYHLYIPNPSSPSLLVPSSDEKFTLSDLPVSHPYAYYSGKEPEKREFKAEVLLHCT